MQHLVFQDHMKSYCITVMVRVTVKKSYHHHAILLNNITGNNVNLLDKFFFYLAKTFFPFGRVTMPIRILFGELCSNLGGFPSLSVSQLDIPVVTGVT